MPRHLLTLCLVAVLCLPGHSAGATPADATRLPDIGDAAGQVITPAEERQIGREYMRNVRMALKLRDDPIIVDYLQNLAELLVSQVDGYEQPITMFLVDDASINAFAGPGGYIGVHTGLIVSAEKEGELVSVLAHELAHVVQRHLLRSVERGKKVELATLAAMVAAIVIGSQNPQAGQAMLSGTLAGSVQQQLNYSRQYEQEADRIGINMMTRAGYDPRDMVSFFEKLQSSNRYAGLRAVEMLQTHPLTLSRIADARNRAEQSPRIHAHGEQEFQLIKVRTLSLDQDPVTFLKSLDELAISPAAHRYGEALAAEKSGNFERARSLIAQLIKEDPHRLLYPYTAGEIELAAQRPAAARQRLQSALTLYPQNALLSGLLAKALLDEGRPAEASALLAEQLRLSPSRRLYALHAQAAKAAGQLSAAYHSLAELAYIDGNTLQAIDYLEQAIAETGDNTYRRLALQARLQAWKDEVKNAARETATEAL